jgi:phage replication-related protein YjqB (UPF0714/DUF867 family)
MLTRNDTYANFAALRKGEPKAAWQALAKRRGTNIAVIAPHGGGIERGTSELALAIADGDLSWYLFAGLKAAGNEDLHITSENFDEPVGVALVESSDTILAVHGASGAAPVVYLGGRDEVFGNRMRDRLFQAGFDVQNHPRLRGALPRNICNRGQSGRGVQLELTMGLREIFFQNMTRAGRQLQTPAFHAFVEAVRGALNLP